MVNMKEFKSLKRVLSRSPSPNLASTTPKKQKNIDKENTLADVIFSPESKRDEPIPTSGADSITNTEVDKSAGDISGSCESRDTHMNQNLPSFAGEFWSILLDIKKELNVIRPEIKSLQDCVNANPVKNAEKPDNSPHVSETPIRDKACSPEKMMIGGWGHARPTPEDSVRL